MIMDSSYLKNVIEEFEAFGVTNAQLFIQTHQINKLIQTYTSLKI